AVDTSTHEGSLAILRDEEVLEQTAIHSDQPHSSQLFEDLNHLTRDADVSLADFDVFAVNAGPGSFTGLRIGLTAVKAWSEIYGRPIAAVSGLEAVAAQASECEKQQSLIEQPLMAAIIDARRGQVFGALYERTAGS